MFRNFPDFKGIKTKDLHFIGQSSTCLETSLTSKGLRPNVVQRCNECSRFRNFPDFKGIKTSDLDSSH